jgi:hypothetical protein
MRIRALMLITLLLTCATIAGAAVPFGNGAPEMDAKASFEPGAVG